MARSRATAEEERAERELPALVGLLEELAMESALLGSKLNELLVIDVDAVVLGYKSAGGTSSAAQLTTDGDNHGDFIYYFTIYN